MSQQEFDSYLSLLCRLLRIAPQQREQVAEEFRTHMEDRLEELLAKGMDREGAVKLALEEFGDAAGLAAQIASISQGRRKRWIMRISVASVLGVALAGLLCLALLPEQQHVPVIAKAQAQQEAEKPTGAPAETPEERIEKALSMPMDLDFNEKPLKEILVTIQEMAKVPVIVAWKKLEEAAINLETPVSFNVKGISLRSGLRLMLGQLGLTYVVEDEVVQITTPEDAGSRQEIRVYDCRDLLNLPETRGGPPREAIKAHSGSLGGASPLPNSPGATPPPVKRDLPNDLVGVVNGTVSPDSWDEVGGPASAKEYKGMLVVLQTGENHEKVEKLLNLMYSAANLDAKVKVSR
ncbi:MAG: permease prefix domain 1-containing protein [Pirellulaceae bacterium]